MVPIHESDVAENRWKESEWDSYELWEVVERRSRRRKTWMIVLSCLLGLFVLALPMYNEKIPKRQGLRYARLLGDRLLDIRRDSSHAQKRFYIQVVQNEHGAIQGNVYNAEHSLGCIASDFTGRTPVYVFPIVEHEQNNIKLVTPDLAQSMGLAGVSDSVCFDPLQESSGETKTFAFVPVKDLTERRDDRISTLTIVDAASFSFD